MSVFTTVTPEQLGAWLRNYSIGVLVGLEGIPAGIENTNYFVITTQGRYVLTLFEKLQLHELPFYLNLMAHLSSHGIPCPKPIANLDNELLGKLNGKPAALVSFLAGKDLLDPQAGHCAQVGVMLANMHLAGKTYTLRMDNPRGLKWWKAVMPEIIPLLSEEDAALLREEVRFQSLYRFSDLPRGVVHADLFRDNVLFDNNQITGVIDFYFACTDALLYDLAIAVNDWCMANGGRLDPVRTAALLEAYRAVRPFTAIERGAWPVMLRAAALRFWVSRLYDFHLPRPGELTHAKDPGHFRQILKQHIANEHDLPPLAI
ncbi:MAG: homoserine kinase [Betaproteobacteria bacterium RIFCSPLOWO2_12_FULL_62_58]|nr:MAG: homoserine kinase [Betaproteobacteria bacterium RIFCSPLOWO2_12_FULL_62_58]